jgi:hypothetical protein
MSSPTSPSFFADITTSRKILKVLHWDKLKNNSGKKKIAWLACYINKKHIGQSAVVHRLKRRTSNRL